MAGAIAQLGTKRTLVVSGDDGLGDVTLSGTTHVTEVSSDSPSPLRGGASSEGLRNFTWQPEDFGIARASLDSLQVDGPAGSAVIIRRLLSGERGPRATSSC